MKILSDRIIYNADDEMPDCGRCDHCCDDYDCSGSCGSEYGWYGYKRTDFDKKVMVDEKVHRNSRPL